MNYLSHHASFGRHSGAFLAVLFLTIPAFPAEGGLQNASEGQLVLYMEAPAGVGLKTSFEVTKLQLAGMQDTIELSPGFNRMVSTELAGKQALLCEQNVPEGQFLQLMVHINKISTWAGTAAINPLPPEQAVTVPLELAMRRGCTEALFLSWNPEKDLLKNKTFSPFLRTVTHKKPPSGAMIYVSNEKSGNVTVIDRFSYQIVDVVRAGEAPGDMAYSADKQELYVLNSRSHDISVIDAAASTLEKTIALRFGDEPIRAELSENGEALYVLNRGSNSISIVGLVSYQEENRVNLDIAPSDFSVDPLRKTAYVASAQSGEVLVADLTSLSIIQRYTLGTAMDKILVNPSANKLYAANKERRQLSVFDLSTQSQSSGALLCPPTTGMAYHARSATLFAASSGCLSISIHKPESQMEINSISVREAPGRIALDMEQQQLAVVIPAKNRVVFYNANSAKQLSTANVGKAPHTPLFAR